MSLSVFQPFFDLPFICPCVFKSVCFSHSLLVCRFLSCVLCILCSLWLLVCPQFVFIFRFFPLAGFLLFAFQSFGLLDFGYQLIITVSFFAGQPTCFCVCNIEHNNLRWFAASYPTLLQKFGIACHKSLISGNRMDEKDYSIFWMVIHAFK